MDLDGDQVEVLVVDAKLPDVEVMGLQLLALTHPKLRVVRQSRRCRPRSAATSAPVWRTVS